MNAFAKPPISRKLPGSEGPVAAILRAWTHQSRAVTTPLLATTLRDCGCWTRERAGTAAALHVLFEIPLHMVDELYAGLVECGLEFDRKARCELSMLCTLGRHSQREISLRKIIALRLAVTFADELEPVTLRQSPAYA